MLCCVLLKTNNNTDDDSCRLVRFTLTWPTAIGAKESVKTLELTKLGEHGPRDINMASVTSCEKRSLRGKESCSQCNVKQKIS